MFWDKTYTPHNIEALLAKEDVTVEEFLEEDDIIQECKTQKKVLLNYFTRTDVIRRLVELITTEPPETLPLNQRFRHANVACEILTLGLPSLDEKLLTDEKALTLLYSYLQNEPPLNSLLASFFSKTFRTLFTKKSDQDWFLYQQMCLKLLEYLKLQNNFVDLICKHFIAPVIPDLILQMMDSAEGGQLKRSLYEWLNEEQLVEKLIAILHNKEESEKYTNVSEFFCDLIEHGRIMRQTEHENDAVESTFEGSNPILKNIESTPTLEALLNVILQPNALESAIISGIMIVLKIIKPVILNEPNSDRLKLLQDREMEIQKDLLTTVIRVIAPHLKYFNNLLINPPHKPDIVISAARLSPPLGNIRLQICRFFTVLLQTRNEEITKVICETSFFDTLLSLFKQYCWNNFLHSEVEKCIQIIFCNSVNNNVNYLTHTINCSTNEILDVNSIFHNIGDNVFNNKEEPVICLSNTTPINNKMELHVNEGVELFEINRDTTTTSELTVNMDTVESDGCEKLTQQQEQMSENTFGIQNGTESKETQENNTTNADGVHFVPSMLQNHVIVNCKIISKLLDCWQYNKEMQSAEKGRRLGYMGYLLKIFNHIKNCISELEHIGALIEKNLQDDNERELWETVIKSEDGELSSAIKIQSIQLANCNPHQFCDEACVVDNIMDNVLHLTESSDILDEDDDDEEDENASSGDGNYIYDRRLLNNTFNIINTTWENNDLPKYNSNSWINDFSTNDFADFADFDAHFSSFHNELREDYIIPSTCNLTPTTSHTAIQAVPVNPTLPPVPDIDLSSITNLSTENTGEDNEENTMHSPTRNTYLEPTINIFNRNHKSTNENNGFENTNTLEEYDNNANVGITSWITPYHLNSAVNVVTLAKFVNECDKRESLWANIIDDNTIVDPIIETNLQASEEIAVTEPSEMIVDQDGYEVVTNGATTHNSDKTDAEVNNETNNADATVSIITPPELNINCTNSSNNIVSNDDGNDLMNDCGGLEMKLTSINLNSTVISESTTIATTTATVTATANSESSAT